MLWLGVLEPELELPSALVERQFAKMNGANRRKTCEGVSFIACKIIGCLDLSRVRGRYLSATSGGENTVYFRLSIASGETKWFYPQVTLSRYRSRSPPLAAGHLGPTSSVWQADPTISHRTLVPAPSPDHFPSPGRRLSDQHSISSLRFRPDASPSAAFSLTLPVVFHPDSPTTANHVHSRPVARYPRKHPPEQRCVSH